MRKDIFTEKKSMFPWEIVIVILVIVVLYIVVDLTSTQYKLNQLITGSASSSSLDYIRQQKKECEKHIARDKECGIRIETYVKPE